MMTFKNELFLLQLVRDLCDNSIRQVNAFVEDKGSVALTREYDANLEKREVDIGFNLFAIISDVYHRENFHSDILKVLIDPNGKHREQEKYLRLFLEYLRAHGAAVSFSDYGNVQVVREEGRLDLLIKDEDSKKAIIIENKIKGAGDQPKQLPRYLQHVKDDGYTCDAIIYLRLNGCEGPDTTGWTPEEYKEVKVLLRVVCAYNETEKDLLNGWIRKCEKVSSNPDAQHILRQYGDIIKKLGGNIMNKPIMEEFYSKMLVGENLKTALSLKAMLDELVLYRVERIIDTFKDDLSPFKKIANYQNDDAYFTGLLEGEAHFGIDIGVEPERYTFSFADRNDWEGTKGRAMKMIKKMNCLDEHDYKDGHFTKKFEFPSQETELFEHIRAFKKRLSEVTSAG